MSTEFEREPTNAQPDYVDYAKIDNSHALADHDEEEGEGPWLLSFADMVTLLMCFFILFFQTEEGNIKLQDPDRLLEKLQALQRVLGMEQDTRMMQIQTEKTPSGSFGSVDSFKKDMQEMSKELDLVFSVGTPHPGEIELTFLNTRFFRSGRADLTRQAMQMLNSVAVKLGDMKGVAEIEVEGHTDSDPIQSVRFPSNWELSSSRASTVVKFLASQGLDPGRMKASGLAHYKPIAPEEDANGRALYKNKALNRRVVVRVKHSLEALEAEAELEQQQKKKKRRKKKRRRRQQERE